MRLGLTIITDNTHTQTLPHGDAKATIEEPKPDTTDSAIAGARPVAARQLFSGIRCQTYHFYSRPGSVDWQRLSTDDCWIGLVLRGRLDLVLPDLGVQHFEAGDWFLLRGELVRFCPAGNSELLLIALPRQMLARIRDGQVPSSVQPALQCLVCPRLEDPTLLQGKVDAGLNRLGEALRAGLSDADPLDFEIRALQWLRTLFEQPTFGRGALCHEVPPDCPQADAPNLRAVAEYLKAHPEASHSLSELSRRFHLNEFKLKRGFKALHGTTVFGYLRERRMEAAAKQLRDPQAGVLETALAVGYSNPSHFARNFKARFGLLPKAYQCIHGIATGILSD